MIDLLDKDRVEQNQASLLLTYKERNLGPFRFLSRIYLEPPTSLEFTVACKTGYAFDLRNLSKTFDPLGTDLALVSGISLKSN